MTYLQFSSLGGQDGQLVTLQVFAGGEGIRINGTPAVLANVVDSTSCTAIKTVDGSVRMVEHLLAALHGMGLWNVNVVVDGAEVPILDGSCQFFHAVMDQLPVVGKPPTPVRLRRCLEVRRDESWIRAVPSDEFCMGVFTDFPTWGVQRFAGGLERFPDAAPARTSGSKEYVDWLHAQELDKGLTPENCLVPGAKLRFPDEPARHKWLDLLGDLTLIGAPLLAHVEAWRPGHRINRLLVKEILASLAQGSPSP